ncbi:MAG: tripartite tricarboxylate transporter TctB family protein [Candidatus Binatia bacterium]|jgi:putative tricarboxylic transport membrane protein
MVRRSKGDLLTGVILTAFGGWVIHEALALPYTSESGPGPGFFPLWIGIGIVLCSCFMLYAYSLRTDPNNESRAKTSKAEIARALGAWLAFVVTIAALPLLGLPVSLGSLTIFLLLILDRRSPWTAASVALGIALGFHLVFPVALSVSLPAGPWGF